MTQVELENLVVTLTAKVDGYVKNFQLAQAQTIETTKHIQDATEKVQGFTESVTQFGQAALVGLTGLGVARWFKEVFSLASGMEHQFLGLSAAIRSNTDDVDNTLEAYKRFSEGMFEVTGTSKRATLELLQMDEMQGLTAKRAMETARQAIALGAASGMDPRSLISRINMAETGSGIRMLGRVPGLRGMTDETAMVDKANRMMAIGMDVSKAQMQSAAGVVRRLSEELEEVKKQFGKLLLEALKPGIELLTKTVQWFKDLDERTKLVILSLAGMTVGVVALVNGLRLLNMAMSILFSGTGGLLAMMLPIAVAAALWAEHLGGVSKAWDMVKAKAQQFLDWIRPAVQGMWDAIRVGAMVMANAIIWVWETLGATFEPIKQLLVTGWHKVEEAASWAAAKVGDVWGPMEVAATSFAATLATLGAILYMVFPRTLEGILPTVLKIFKVLIEYTIGMLPAMVAAIKDAVSEACTTISSAGSTTGSVLQSVGEWFVRLPAKISAAANWIANLIEKIPPLIHQSAKDGEDLVGIIEWIARAFRWANEQASLLANHISRIASSIWTTVSPAIEYVTGRLASLWHSILSTFNSIAPAMSRALEYVFEKVAPAISMAFEGVISVLKVVVKTLSDQLSNLKWDLQSIVTVTVTVLGTVVGLLAAKRAAWASIVIVVQALYSRIAWIVTAVQALVTWVSGLSKLTLIVAVLASGFSLLGDKFIPVAAAFLAWLAWAGPRMSFIVGLITLLAARTDLVWQALAKVKEFFSWIANSNEWITNLANKVAAFFRWIGSAIGPAISAIGEFFSSLWQSAVVAFDLIRNAASEAFGVVREVAGEVFSALSEVVANFNWNLQNTVTVIAAVAGIVAGMSVFLLAWAVAAKVVTVAMLLLGISMLPQKLALAALNVLYLILDTLLLVTGVKLVLTTAAWIVYKIGVMMAAGAKAFFTLATLTAIVSMMALMALLIAVSAVLVGIVVAAFVAAANAVMALVEAIKAMTMFSGAADAFRHWKGILGGLVTAIQVDMGFAWKYVQDAMHLAGEEVKAYWPPVWARIKEGFLLLWEVVSTSFLYKMEKAVHEFIEATPFFQVEENDRKRLARKEKEAKEAMDRINEYSKRALNFGDITTPGMDAARTQMEANIANAAELAKLKKAADEEADKAAKKHKEELDTATRLNNLAQQHNELKRAELVLANSADAIYKIQAFRAAQQAMMEARAAQMRKDALDKEPEKGPAQLAFEVGKAAAMRGEDATVAVAKSRIEAAKTVTEAAEVAAEEYKKALGDGSVATKITRTMELIGKAWDSAEAASRIAAAKTDAARKYWEAESKLSALDRQRKDALGDKLDYGATVREGRAIEDKFHPLIKAAEEDLARASKDYQDSVESKTPQATGQVPPQESDKGGGFFERVSNETLLRIEGLLRDGNKKPTLDMRPVGLK